VTTGQLTFNHIQLEFLRSMAEALFDDFAEMAISVDQVVENMQELVGMIGGTKAQEISLATTLAQLAMAPFFEELSVDGRKARLRHRMQETRIEALQELARLKSILYFCYYGHWQDPVGDGDTLEIGQVANEHNPVLKQIGFTLPRFRPRRLPGDVPINLVPGREIDPRHIVPIEHKFDDIDVIVIGSGSGGAVSALNLAKWGHKVLIIEAGPHYPSGNITHEERRMASHLFKHGALQTTNDNAIVVFQGRNVGGSPTINNGICIRMHGDPLNHPDAPDPLAKWRDMGAGLDEARFGQAYDAVQDYLGIRQIEPRSSRSNGPHLLGGWSQFAAAHDQRWARRAPAGWFSKNFGPAGSATPCCYCGYCNTGCPYGRKLGMAQTYLPDATAKHGALILAETRVDRIEWAGGNGGQRRAVGVIVTDADGGEHRIQARKGVVVAAGTIASSLLLDRSGIAGTGQQISMNIASPVIALMPEGVSPAWDEDQMATMVDCGDFLFESHFQPPLSMASLMPGWFADMDRRMRAYDRICSAGVLFPADRRGRIVGGKLEFKLTQDDLALLRRAAATLTKVHFADGALEVWPALLRGQTLTPEMDIDAFYEDAIRETDDVTVSSSHPHGGNPINADPELGVVDTGCRVHGTDNVLVTDASVFPSCIRVNAQFSTMAIAQYATGFADPFG
jgi:choline dehydrogenase-like flavoprotein